MVRFLNILVVVLILNNVSLAQGSGNALSLNGSSFLDLSTHYENLNFPITISYWLYKPSQSLGMVFSSSYSSTGYSGIWSQISSDQTLHLSYGTNFGYTPQHRHSISTYSSHCFKEWVHYAFVIVNSTNMKAYVNGNLVASYNNGYGGSYFESSTGTGSLGRVFGAPGWRHLQGMVDDFTIWDEELPIFKVRDLVCANTNGSSFGLLGYYNLDNQIGLKIADISINGHDGTLKGSAKLSTSGAAIGNVSHYKYEPNISEFKQTLDSNLNIEVSNITPAISGVQVYEVQMAPSNTMGIPFGSEKNYFGVFLAPTDNQDYTFQLKILNFDNDDVLYKRKANNSVTWEIVAPISLINDTALFPRDTLRQEYMYIPYDSIPHCNNFQLTVPNVFTPNDDGINDNFFITANCPLDPFTIHIFNRWGEVVYFSNDEHFVWTSNEAAKYSDGVYFYLIEYGTSDLNNQSEKGTVTLLK